MKLKKTILVDGAIGTQMIERGIETGGVANLNNPKDVMEIHKDYFDAGSDVIFTNTFTSNRIYVQTHNLDIDVMAANKAGVEIAKMACPKGKYVLADMGSTGQLLTPYGTYTEEEFYQNFREQAQIFLEGGIDGFVIETQTDVRETRCVTRACRSISDLPILVSDTFSKTPKGFVTMMGNYLTECVQNAVDEGADVVGANCGELAPAELAEVVSAIKSISNIPVIVQPNAGKPKLVDGITKYDMSPEVFAEGIKKCIEAGAHLVGGCCGTTPEHIGKVRCYMDDR